MEYRSLSRLVYLAAGLFVAIWFLHEVIDVILLLFFAVVITIVLNAPVTWLQKKRISRTVASLLVFFGVLTVFALIGWMVIPKIVTQVKLLLTQLPDYLDSLNKRVSGWIGDHGVDNGNVSPSVTPVTDQLTPYINSIGQYTLGIFKNVLLVIFFFAWLFICLSNRNPYWKCISPVLRKLKEIKLQKLFPMHP
jgi:predicted PurR-regulated permease PerM